MIDESNSYYKCAGNEIVWLLKEKPKENFCVPIHIKKLIDLVSNETYPLCGTPGTEVIHNFKN